MSSKHLSKGSENPPKIEEKLRLYGMLFCPYVLRVRLVLLAKKIPHDIVYVDLQNKPEWLFELNPKGQVPILDVGSKIISESLEICYYLEKHFPEPRLCPEGEERQKEDKALIEKIDEAIGVFYRSMIIPPVRKIKDILCENKPKLEYFEEELGRRGNFFNGENVGLVDYMAWPWVEKLPMFNLIFNENITFPEGYKNLRNWKNRMLELETVKETLIDVKRHYQYTVFVKQTNEINVNDV